MPPQVSHGNSRMTCAMSPDMIDPADVVADKQHWRLHRGANVTPNGSVMFSVWAPTAESVVVHVETASGARDIALTKATDKRGVWEREVPDVKSGDRYGYRVDGSDPLPDPVSRHQPDGVHALSAVIDPGAFQWTDAAWKGMSLADFVIYEIHLGTFTSEGTFDAAAGRLAELAALGITAIEIMPVAQFPGRRNWGYDGVQLYAPQNSYGGPDAFRRLVDKAHSLGIGVILDVVYNHVGPEGNYLDRFGPYFTDVYRTPWGRALNYDGAGSDAVRRWAHDNALHWVSEYHLDALRLDAVQGIYDFGALSFLEELSNDIHALGRQEGRKVQLMAESDLNDPKLIRSPKFGGFGLDAQWADDVHHTIHTTLTGEGQGYYQDFNGVATMPDVYREPFFYSGQYAPHRDRTHGGKSAGVPRQRFVISAQNHDQVGNRPNGERLTLLVDRDKQRLAAALVLLSPYIPLLFMGEEYGETAPFVYFIEHGDPDLIAAVRAGRQREYDERGAVHAQVDPQSETPFLMSKLEWAKRESLAGSQMLSLYRDLLALRREEPALRPGASDVHVQGTADWMTVLRVMPVQNDAGDFERSRRAVFYVFNLSHHSINIPVRADAIGSWRLRFSTDAPGYGGNGSLVNDILPVEEHLPDPDAPKRLMALPPRPAPPLRTLLMPASSAAFYVRSFPQDADYQ